LAKRYRSTLNINGVQLIWLLDGLDIARMIPHKVLQYESVCWAEFVTINTVYSTNNNVVRKATHNRMAFPKGDSVKKVEYLTSPEALRSLGS